MALEKTNRGQPNNPEAAHVRSSPLQIILLLLALLAVVILAWQIPVPAPEGVVANADEKLVIVTPHWDGIRNEFRRAFVPWYRRQTGRSIDIEWLDPGGTSDCVKYIKSEFRRTPHGIGVDLFFGGGTDPYLDFAKEGILAVPQLDSGTLSGVPRTASGIELYDADGFWYGAVLSGFGIIYNKWVVERLGFDVPREWKDLANPRYASWIGVADPRNSGTMHLMFEIILQAYGWERGWEILTGIAANARTFSKGASDVPRMVSRGDMAFGLAIDFYGWAEVAEAGDDKVGFVLPENLTVINPDAIAMLKGAPNALAASKFISFVLSEQGQKLWFLRKGAPGGPVEQELDRMTIRPDLYQTHGAESNVKQNPFSSNDVFRFDNQLASSRWGVLNDLAGVSLIDQSEALRKAWSGLDTSRSDLPPTWRTIAVDEASSLKLAEGDWRDPVAKNRTLVAWHDFYARKYRTLVQEQTCTK